jgi:hypothetical protein
MTEVVVIALLAFAAGVYVARPLLAGPRREPEDVSRLIEEAEERKHVALTAILDVEEEHEVGKLAAADFEVLRTQYEADALAALRELDALVAQGEATDELEAEIARMRAGLTCPDCGAIRTSTVCSSCGASS